MLLVGFFIYKLDDKKKEKVPLDREHFRYHSSFAQSPGYINQREVVKNFKFEPGSYVIVPTTFEPEEEGEFLLRIFSEKIKNFTMKAV